VTGGPSASDGEPDRAASTLRHRVFEILEVGRHGDLASVAADALIISTIVVNTATVVLRTVPEFHQRFDLLFVSVEHVASAIFVVEYLLRLWVCVDRLEYRNLPPLRARLRYAVTVPALIDLLAIIPILLQHALGAHADFISMIRLLRLFKLARYSTGLASLGRVLRAESRALTATLTLMLLAVVLSASLAHLAEREAQPDKFGSIPEALWWAITTLTTVGYGDVVPITDVGRLIGGITMVCGLVFFALPVGLVASGFSQELHRADFIVRWEMLARVPLFSGLDLGTISRLAGRLRTRRVRSGEWIWRVGEPSDGLYLISDGRAVVRSPVPMGELVAGDFFGELALLLDEPHKLSVQAETACRLFILDSDAFHELMNDFPKVREQVEAVVSQRLSDLDEPHEVSRAIIERSFERRGRLALSERYGRRLWPDPRD